MSYAFRPIFREPDEEESFGEAAAAVRLRTAIAQLAQIAGQLRVRIDFDALLHDLQGEAAELAQVEAELELTFPSDRTPEQQAAALYLGTIKNGARLAEAAAALVRVYGEVTRK